MRFHHFFFLLVLVAATAKASTIDPRETHAMLDALQQAGVQVQTGSHGETRLVARQIDCLHTTPANGDETKHCDLRDDASGAALHLDGGHAGVVFILVGHYGGDVTQWHDGDVFYQRATADRVVCERDPGENEPWLCDVRGSDGK